MSAPADTDALVEQWLAIPSDDHKRLAEVEDAMFQVLRDRTPRGEVLPRKREYLGELLDAHTRQFDVRGALLIGGDAAEPLWTALGAGSITLHRAAKLWRDHRRDPKAKEAIAAVLGFTAPEVNASGTLNAATRTLQAGVRHLLTSYVEDALAGTDPVEAANCTERFMGGLELLLEDLRREVGRERKNAKPVVAKRVKRAAFEGACLSLSISATWGDSIDPKRLHRARKQQRFEFHPDRNNGDANTEILQEINEAHDLLVAYNEQRRKQ